MKIKKKFHTGCTYAFVHPYVLFASMVGQYFQLTNLFSIAFVSHRSKFIHKRMLKVFWLHFDWISTNSYVFHRIYADRMRLMCCCANVCDTIVFRFDGMHRPKECVHCTVIICWRVKSFEFRSIEHCIHKSIATDAFVLAHAHTPRKSDTERKQKKKKKNKKKKEETERERKMLKWPQSKL